MRDVCMVYDMDECCVAIHTNCLADLARKFIARLVLTRFIFKNAVFCFLAQILCRPEPAEASRPMAPSGLASFGKPSRTVQAKPSRYITAVPKPTA